MLFDQELRAIASLNEFITCSLRITVCRAYVLRLQGRNFRRIPVRISDARFVLFYNVEMVIAMRTNDDQANGAGY